MQYKCNEEQQIDTMLTSNYNLESFIRVFDGRFNEYLGEKGQGLRSDIQRVNNEFALLAIKWNKIHHHQFNCTNNQNKLNSIQKNYEQVIEEIYQIIKQKQEIQNRMIKKYINNIDNVRQLQQSTHKVWIKDSNSLDIYKTQILEYQQHAKDYKIDIDFNYQDSSLDWKMKVIKVIDDLNVNHKVAKIVLKLKNSTSMNEEIIRIMINKYQNVYAVYIDDRNSSIDTQVHDQIKQLIKQSTVLMFGLSFRYGSLFHHKGLLLLKQYNQLIEQKQYLEYLWYCHSQIDKSSYSKSEIQCIIEQVNNI